jgi:hypothetical protein
MTVKKAISHIDLLIQDKQDLKMKMIGPVLPLPIPGDLVNRFDRVNWKAVLVLFLALF